MLQLAADENFNNDIVRGARRLCPSIDILRVQDGGMMAADDAAVLEWAAELNRVLLTHDVSTMTRFAYDRIREGRRMPGVFEVSRRVPIRQAIDDVILLAECSLNGEWEGQVRYFPLT